MRKKQIMSNTFTNSDMFIISLMNSSRFERYVAILTHKDPYEMQIEDSSVSLDWIDYRIEHEDTKHFQSALQAPTKEVAVQQLTQFFSEGIKLGNKYFCKLSSHTFVALVLSTLVKPTPFVKKVIEEKVEEPKPVPVVKPVVEKPAVQTEIQHVRRAVPYYNPQKKSLSKEDEVAKNARAQGERARKICAVNIAQNIRCEIDLSIFPTMVLEYAEEAYVKLCKDHPNALKLLSFKNANLEVKKVITDAFEIKGGISVPVNMFM